MSQRQVKTENETDSMEFMSQRQVKNTKWNRLKAYVNETSLYVNHQKETYD